MPGCDVEPGKRTREVCLWCLHRAGCDEYTACVGCDWSREGKYNVVTVCETCRRNPCAELADHYQSCCSYWRAERRGK